MNFKCKSFSRFLALFPLVHFFTVFLSQTFGKEKDKFLVILFLSLSYSLDKNVIMPISYAFTSSSLFVSRGVTSNF